MNKCLVAGSGIASKVLALRLNQLEVETEIIGSDKKYFNNIRTVTLNPQSYKVLKDLNIGLCSSPIESIKVLDGEGSGKITFTKDEFNIENLAYVVRYDELNKSLEDKTRDILHHDLCIKNFLFSGSVNCELSNGKNINTDLLILTESFQSDLVKQFNKKSHVYDYNQTAFTFTVITEDLNPSEATQIFYENEIFAIMPINTSQNEWSVVWSIPRSKLEETDYIESNLSRVSNRLGADIVIDSNILKFDIFGHRFVEYVEPGVCLLADSAHSIHPLAGQGLNLAIADVEVLRDELYKAINNKLAIGELSTLKKYEMRRKIINDSMLKGINAINSLFQNNNIYYRLIRNNGLKFVDAFSPLKKVFVRYALGQIKL